MRFNKKAYNLVLEETGLYADARFEIEVLGEAAYKLIQKRTKLYAGTRFEERGLGSCV